MPMDFFTGKEPLFLHFNKFKKVIAIIFGGIFLLSLSLGTSYKQKKINFNDYQYFFSAYSQINIATPQKDDNSKGTKIKSTKYLGLQKKSALFKTLLKKINEDTYQTLFIGEKCI